MNFPDRPGHFSRSVQNIPGAAAPCSQITLNSPFNVSEMRRGSTRSSVHVALGSDRVTCLAGRAYARGPGSPPLLRLRSPAAPARTAGRDSASHWHGAVGTTTHGHLQNNHVPTSPSCGERKPSDAPKKLLVALKKIMQIFRKMLTYLKPEEQIAYLTLNRRRLLCSLLTR